MDVVKSRERTKKQNILKLQHERKTVKEIATELGCTPYFVYRVLKDNGEVPIKSSQRIKFGFRHISEQLKLIAKKDKVNNAIDYIF